jgi:hypothetical protein
MEQLRRTRGTRGAVGLQLAGNTAVMALAIADMRVGDTHAYIRLSTRPATQ